MKHRSRLRFRLREQGVYRDTLRRTGILKKPIAFIRATYYRAKCHMERIDDRMSRKGTTPLQVIPCNETHYPRRTENGSP